MTYKNEWQLMEEERQFRLQQAAAGLKTGGDMVNAPPHYTDGGIETIDFIQAKLDDEQFYGYCLGNAMKYLSRAGKKGDWKEDLRKAIWYLNRALGE